MDNNQSPLAVFTPFEPLGKEVEVFHPNLEGWYCLYQYVTMEQLNLIRKSKSIKLSRYRETNDITELPLLTGKPYEDEKYKTHGYICLSSTAQSPMMWGQYADRGRGACLVFAFKITPCQHDSSCFYLNILTNKSDGTIVQSNEHLRLRAVTYGKNLELITNDEELMASKAEDWSYEKEYRILFKLAELSNSKETSDGALSRMYLYAPIMKSLVRVILGPCCDIDENDAEKSLRESFKSLPFPISVVKARVNYKKQNIEIHTARLYGEL